MTTSSVVEVLVQPSSLNRSRLGGITGVVFLRNASWSFPGPEWSDSPVVILAWWLAALQELTSGAPGSVSCRFMDGPFLFRVAAFDHGQWLLQCFEEPNDVPVHHAVVDPREFLSSLRQAAVSIITACHANGWDSPDLITLRRASLRHA